MIHKDDKGKVTRGWISDFLDLPAPLRAGSRAEELALLSGGWREERARMRRRDSGCGCAFLGLFFGLFFLAGCGFLVVCARGFLLDWRANNRYLPNSCVVLDRRLATGMSNDVVVSGDFSWTVQRPSYHPEIKIQYEVGGRKYEVWTYDTIVSFSTDRAAQQAIVDSFRVGATYPCWYDPDRPDRAILVRGRAWYSYGAIIVPIVFLAFGGAGIRHLWKNREKGAHQHGAARAL
jgi:hypothetical protein